MCLIIDNVCGREIPRALVRDAAIGNPDGWGIMSTRRGRIHVARGWGARDLSRAIRARRDERIVVHLRWATHGTVNLGMTHPFVSPDAKYALMHNGIIDIRQSDKSKSDTWHFATEILWPILAERPDVFDHAEFPDALAELAGIGNKLVVMRSDGEVVRANESAGTNWRGLWLSNGYSIPLPRRSRRRVSKWRLSANAWDRLMEAEAEEMEAMEADELRWPFVDDYLARPYCAAR